MSDSPGPLDERQRHGDALVGAEAHLDGRQAQIHTTMPGIIVSYDPGKMTAVVQPAIQAMHRQLDQTKVPTNIHEIHDVPVHFPGGGGYTLTFPVKPGDECLIHFSERSIDNWHQQGGTQAPSDARMHDINDAIVTVGLRSQKRPLGAAGAFAVSRGGHGDNVQLRADGGASFIELSSGGKVRIVAPGGVEIVAPDVKVVGGDVHADTISLKHHKHKDTQPGGGESGEPKP
jgi:hypothetical protein